MESFLVDLHKSKHFHLPEKVYMILELQLKYKFLLYLIILSRSSDDIAKEGK